MNSTSDTYKSRKNHVSQGEKEKRIAAIPSPLQLVIWFFHQHQECQQGFQQFPFPLTTTDKQFERFGPPALLQ